MLPKDRPTLRTFLRLASDPTTRVDRAGGAAVPARKRSEIGLHAILPTKRVSQEAIWDNTRIGRIGIAKRRVRIGGDDAGIVDKDESVAIHGTIAMRTAERPQVDQLVMKVFFLVFLRR